MGTLYQRLGNCMFPWHRQRELKPRRPFISIMVEEMSLFLSPSHFFFLNASSAQINCKALYSVHSGSQRKHRFSLGSICWWFVLFKFIQSHYLNVNSQVR